MNDKKIKDEELFRKLIEEKKTVKEIAEYFETSEPTVRSTAKRLGIKLNNREEVKKRLHDNFEFIKEGYEKNGLTFEAIGKQIGVNAVALRRYYYSHIFGFEKRPSVDFDSLKDFIKQERRCGTPIREIADRINADYYELEQYCKKNGIRNEFNINNYIKESDAINQNLNYADNKVKIRRTTETYKDGMKTVTKTFDDITDFFSGKVIY